MGTSGSFSGSGGKDASDLRDNIAGWLDDTGGDADAGRQIGLNGDSPADPYQLPSPALQPRIDLGPALRTLFRVRGSGGAHDAPGGGGVGRRDTSGRSSGGATRSVGRISQAAGRAGQLAVAYSTGNRETLREAGLDYDELRALGDPLTVGIKIIEAAFESQADSTLADAEERDIVATIVEWILEYPEDRAPTPEEVVRKAIEVTIAEIALTEVSATIYAKQVSPEKRRNLEWEIRGVAAELAAQANLSSAGATDREMARAIENGLRDLGKIFGVTP